MSSTPSDKLLLKYIDRRMQKMGPLHSVIFV